MNSNNLRDARKSADTGSEYPITLYHVACANVYRGKRMSGIGWMVLVIEQSTEEE